MGNKSGTSAHQVRHSAHGKQNPPSFSFFSILYPPLSLLLFLGVLVFLFFQMSRPRLLSEHTGHVHRTVPSTIEHVLGDNAQSRTCFLQDSGCEDPCRKPTLTTGHPNSLYTCRLPHLLKAHKPQTEQHACRPRRSTLNSPNCVEIAHTPLRQILGCNAQN